MERSTSRSPTKVLLARSLNRSRAVAMYAYVAAGVAPTDAPATTMVLEASSVTSHAYSRRRRAVDDELPAGTVRRGSSS